MSKFGHWVGGVSSAAIFAASVYLYATYDPTTENNIERDHVSIQEPEAINLPEAFEQVAQPSELPHAPALLPEYPASAYTYVQGESIPLNPYLIKALEDRAEVRGYLVLIKESYDMHGMDWRIGANMLFRESYHFSPAIVTGAETSNRAAYGIAQFTEEAAADYGFLPDEVIDPSTAISLNASHMNSLLERYDGDVILALIAYNGGNGAVGWIRESLECPNADGTAAIAFLQERRDTIGNSSPHAYHVETLDYVVNILGLNVDEWEHPRWVQSQNNKLNDPVFAAILESADYVEIAHTAQSPTPPESTASESSVRPRARPDFSNSVVAAAPAGMTRPQRRPEHIVHIAAALRPPS